MTCDHAQQMVTDDAVAAYQRDGAVCLRGLLSSEEVALLREGIDHNLAAPSPRASATPTTPAALSKTSATGSTTALTGA
jgi:hypothetical protein